MDNSKLLVFKKFKEIVNRNFSDIKVIDNSTLDDIHSDFVFPDYRIIVNIDFFFIQMNLS